MDQPNTFNKLVLFSPFSLGTPQLSSRSNLEVTRSDGSGPSFQQNRTASEKGENKTSLLNVVFFVLV